MKQTYFHGTSADNLKSILKHGLKTDRQKLWNPSCDEVYLWSPKRLADTGDADTEADARELAKERAYDSAQCAMVVGKSGQCVVFEIELDDSLVADDDSCSNMDGAVSTTEPIKPKQIRAVWISPDLAMLKGYFVNQVKRNELFGRTFTRTELQIAELFSKGEFYFDSSDFPLELMERN